MYQRYAELNAWKTQIVNINDTGLGGLKEVTFEIKGKGVFSRLKHEAGTHRVQRVPSTESKGRIHTSAITVAILPKPDDIDVKVNLEDIRTDIFHSGGAVATLFTFCPPAPPE
jgi:peptide chain release factor 1